MIRANQIQPFVDSPAMDFRNPSDADCVFIVDSDSAVRRTIRQLAESAGMRAESFDSAEDFLERADRRRTGCLIMEFCLPGISGMQLLERLETEGVWMPAIIVSGHADVAAAVRAVKLGAADVFLKPFSEVSLLESIRNSIARNRRKRQIRTMMAEFEGRMKQLNPRETRVVELVINGLATKQIALELQVSAKTIESCRTRIMEVLEVSNAAELAARVATAKTRRELGIV